MNRNKNGRGFRLPEEGNFGPRGTKRPFMDLNGGEAMMPNQAGKEVNSGAWANGHNFEKDFSTNTPEGSPPPMEAWSEESPDRLLIQEEERKVMIQMAKINKMKQVVALKEAQKKSEENRNRVGAEADSRIKTENDIKKREEELRLKLEWVELEKRKLELDRLVIELKEKKEDVEMWKEFYLQHKDCDRFNKKEVENVCEDKKANVKERLGSIPGAAKTAIQNRLGQKVETPNVPRKKISLDQYRQLKREDESDLPPELILTKFGKNGPVPAI